MSTAAARRKHSLPAQLTEAKKKIAQDEQALVKNAAEVKANDASYLQAEQAQPQNKDVFESIRKAEDAKLGTERKAIEANLAKEKKKLASLEKNPKLLPFELKAAKKTLASDKGALTQSRQNERNLDAFVKTLETSDPANKATYEKDRLLADAQAKTEQTGLEKKIAGDKKEIKTLEKKIAALNAGGPKLSKAVNIAMKAVQMERSSGCYDYTQAYGGRTNYGLGPTTRQGNGRLSFDCSGFVGAVYKAAGLPSPYTVGYAGTSFDVAGCKNMVQVSESRAKPGDVVVFPDHIALYIGGGKCISMGQEGDPAIVTVAAEAAYNNRGIQGFYHPRGA